jgi:multicomponent Na+:H+ antiporter subunit F
MILQSLMLYIVLPLLAVSVLFTLVRLILGPSLSDRVVALDLMAIIGIGLIAAYSIATDNAAFLDIAIILALLGFLSTVAFAYYIERRV